MFNLGIMILNVRWVTGGRDRALCRIRRDRVIPTVKEIVTGNVTVKGTVSTVILLLMFILQALDYLKNYWFELRIFLSVG